MRMHTLIVEDQNGIRVYRLNQSIYTVGRSRDADIRLYCEKSSRNQATLVRVLNQQGETIYRLVDGDITTGKPSRNGTYVNDNPVYSYDLKDFDQIQFGSDVKGTYFCWQISLTPDQENILNLRSDREVVPKLSFASVCYVSPNGETVIADSDTFPHRHCPQQKPAPSYLTYFSWLAVRPHKRSAFTLKSFSHWLSEVDRR